MTSLRTSLPLAPWLARIARHWQEARRMRRGLAELSRMSAHELRDLGITHAAMGAAVRRDPCCA